MAIAVKLSLWSLLQIEINRDSLLFLFLSLGIGVVLVTISETEY
jgi:hypothetical protein